MWKPEFHRTYGKQVSSEILLVDEFILTVGPSNKKMNLVGTGTSVKSPKCKAVFNLTKIEIGF